MGRISGGALVARTLARLGVKHLFTLCGNHLLSVYDACLDHGVRLVDTRHESGATHMADGWARVTGEPGVALVTGGPGLTNALTGLLAAYGSDSPVVLLSGASDIRHAEMGALQEIDQVALAAPCTKWSRQVPETRRIPDYIARAYRAALAGRPGPAHLAIPSDLLDASADEDSVVELPVGDHLPECTYAPRERIDRALALLAAAERPLVVAGAGAWHARAGEQLRAFVEATGLPVMTIEQARGLISDRHPLCLGYADPSLNDAARLAARADVVLILGKRLDYRVRFGAAYGPDAKLIQVDADPELIGANRAVALGIVGDVAGVLEQMAHLAPKHKWTDRPWVEELRRARESQRAEHVRLAATPGTPPHPVRIAREIGGLIDERTILVFDGGDFVHWTRADLDALRPGGWVRLGSMASLGAGVPFSIAAKLAYPDARVLLITGDGSIGFYFIEFDTAMRHNVPFVALVGNDAAWGIERHFQIGLYGEERAVGSALRLTRYDDMVRALGGHGAFVEDPSAIAPAVERAFDSHLPACVNVPISPTASSFTRAMVETLRGR